VLNKIDTLQPEELETKVAELKKIRKKPILISAATHKNIEELVKVINSKI